jgi:acetyl-CoA carboxylase biotin carboxylase subunit
VKNVCRLQPGNTPISPYKFMKVLIANRGEIAVRILRSCRELGFKSVAVFSESDEQALHTRYADEAVCIGPVGASASYLNIPAVLDACKKTGADAVHPGYGFLSENPDFAKEVEEAGIRFIGPTPKTIALTGDKLEARRVAREAGLPVLSGSESPLAGEIPVGLAEKIRYPILIKAVAGGGGRGIRLAHSAQEFEQMLEAARKEAYAAFGNDTVYLEQLVQSARHIEVQILGDGDGHYLCLGERECSIQRRRQKLIEEAPAPNLPKEIRQRLYEDALRLARVLNYRSLGTVEFLMDQENNYYFIEVNPRIQVEHPVTEAVTRTDLVGAQLQLAEQGNLAYKQAQLNMQGWAIEARILAEDPDQGFLPVSGSIDYLKESGGLGIRVDSALYAGMPVTTDYDSLLAKVIAWGEDRPHAIRRLLRALGEFRIGGIPTDLEFLSQIIGSESFRGGTADTTYLDNFKMIPVRLDASYEKEMALAAALITHRESAAMPNPEQQTGNNIWRMAAWREQMSGLM